MGPHAGAEIGGGIVIRQNSCHLLHILGALVGQDIDSIIDRDDTHEHALVVQNGHGGKVVALHLAGHILLIVRDLHGDNVVIHDLGDGGVQICQQQAARRNNAHQAVALHHIAGVHGLGVLALLADGVECLRHGHILPQADIFGGHQAAGRAFGVVQQLVQALAGLLGGLFQHTLDHACRHIFQQVGSVIQTHLFDGAHQLHIREGVDQIVAGFVGHISKGFGGNFLFQQAEHYQTVVLVQFFQQLGQVGGLFFLGHFAQLDVLLFDQQLQQAALGEHLGVGLDFLVVGLLFFGLAHILLEILGGFFIQILSQFLTDLGRDISGQFLHGHGLLGCRFLLLVFQFHWAYLLIFYGAGVSPVRRTQQIGEQKNALPCRTETAVSTRTKPRLSLLLLRKSAPQKAPCPLTRRKRRTQLFLFSDPPHRCSGLDYDPGPLFCVHLQNFLFGNSEKFPFNFIIAP